jgi:hypothetical protein
MATQGKSTTWSNADGLQVGFGTRTTNNDEAFSLRQDGNKYILEMRIDATNGGTITTTGTTTSAAHGYHIPIPAGSVITAGYFMVETAFVGATAKLNIGLKTSAGAEVDYNGLLTDTNGEIAKIDANGDCVALDGALVGAVVDTTGYLCYQAVTASLTAGIGVVRVEYIRPSLFLGTESLEA